MVIKLHFFIVVKFCFWTCGDVIIHHCTDEKRWWERENFVFDFAERQRVGGRSTYAFDSICGSRGIYRLSPSHHFPPYYPHQEHPRCHLHRYHQLDHWVLMVIRTRTKRTVWRGSPHSIWSLSHLRDCQASTNQLPPSFLSFYLFQPLIAFRRRGRQILPLILSFRPLSRDLLKATLPPSAKTAHKYQGFILSFLFSGFIVLTRYPCWAIEDGVWIH